MVRKLLKLDLSLKINLVKDGKSKPVINDISKIMRIFFYFYVVTKARARVCAVCCKVKEEKAQKKELVNSGVMNVKARERAACRCWGDSLVSGPPRFSPQLHQSAHLHMFKSKDRPFRRINTNFKLRSGWEPSGSTRGFK